MIDLSKSYGLHEGVQFYGDHQDDNIVYYLPDTIQLAPRQGKDDQYEFSLQLFHNNQIVDADGPNLADTAGSILQLSMICTTPSEQLRKAFSALRESLPSIPAEATLTSPLWTDGSVDLITLDQSSFGEESNSSMVKAIVSTQRPSFSQDVKGIFNVRYDKQGTELIHSAIMGGESLTAVAYDLQFPALRPTFDLKITAFLSRCQETARKNIDVDIRIPIKKVAINLGAHLEWLTQKMVDNGDIKIEVTKEVTDEEEKREIDRLVDEMKEQVLQELFKPSFLHEEEEDGITDIAAKLTKLIDLITPVKLSFCYRLKEETISEERILSVDYSERSATICHHNPKAILLAPDNVIAVHYDDYVKHVTVGELWNSQNVDIELFHDFDSPDNDLLSVEVILWKHSDGILQKASDNCFALPPKTQPLANFIFTPHDQQKRHSVSWLCTPAGQSPKPDDSGYYYQLRFRYSSNVDNHCSPVEIVTPPVLAYAMSLPIVPDSYMFFRNIPVIKGSVDFSLFEKVEIILDVVSPDGTPLVTNKRFLLTETSEDLKYAVRGKDHSELLLYATKNYYYKDKSLAPLKFPRQQLKDYGMVIDDPTIIKPCHPILLGDTDSVEKLIISFTVSSPILSRPVSFTKMLNPNDENPIMITYYSPDDEVSYEITKVFKDADGKRKTEQVAKETKPIQELDNLYIEL